MQRFPVVIPGQRCRRASLPYHSLAERAHELQSQLDAEPAPHATPHAHTLEGLTVPEIYDKLYLDFFEERSRRKNSERNANALQRAWTWCVDNKVDFGTYVAANMTLMRDKTLRYGFQPNMLSGVNAQKRYHGYMARTNRQFRHGHRSARIQTDTWLGRTRVAAVLTETAVAEIYVGANLNDCATTWEEAMVSAGGLCVEWKSLTNRRGKAWVELCKLWNTERAESERQLMILHAAWNVAQGLQPGLPERIGYTEFLWPSFLSLMQEILPERRVREKVDLSDVDVVQWGKGLVDG